MSHGRIDGYTLVTYTSYLYLHTCKACICNNCCCEFMNAAGYVMFRRQLFVAPSHLSGSYRPCELGESVYFGRGQGKMMGYGGYKQKPGTAGVCHIDIGFYISKEELGRKTRDGWRLGVGLCLG